MLFLDTSALLKRYIEEPDTPSVLDLMGHDTVWSASSLVRVEAELGFCRIGYEERQVASLRRQLRQDLELMFLVSPDDAILARASAIGCEHRLKTLDSIHVASAERVASSTPVFVTFDRRQAMAARALGFSVVGDPG